LRFEDEFCRTTDDIPGPQQSARIGGIVYHAIHRGVAKDKKRELQHATAWAKTAIKRGTCH
jgi:hypothetical protein